MDRREAGSAVHVLKFNLFTFGIHFRQLGKASDISFSQASVLSLIREVG